MRNINNIKSKILLVVLIALVFIFVGLFLSTKFNRPQLPMTNDQLPVIPSPTISFPREEAYINYVFDGDTIGIKDKVTLRLLGIDAPETANKYTMFKSECFASESAKIAREIMMGQNVELEKDIEDKDEYGRLLRYVFLDDVFINEFLVRQGYAKVESKTINTRYKNLFIEAENEAKMEKRGLWGKCY